MHYAAWVVWLESVTAKLIVKHQKLQKSREYFVLPSSLFIKKSHTVSKYKATRSDFDAFYVFIIKEAFKKTQILTATDF